MATAETKQEEILKRIWIVKALELQKAALVRSRNKEIPGSEMYEIRTREMNLLEKYILEYKS